MGNANKVMIIDDKDTFILPLEIGLKQKGIEVISFTNPEEAIEYLKTNNIDVLLTDYHMEPAINGDEVVRRVREFNKDIVIYLQTAYAETLPADEMLDKYDIQGYIDKNEGQEKNIPLIKAGLKQAELVKLVKKQREQLNAQQYKDEFFGSFVNLIVEEINNKTMAMSGPLMLMEEALKYIPNEEKDEYNRFTNNAKQAISELSELAKSINIETERITADRFKQIITRLLKLDLVVNNSTLDFSVNNEYLALDCNPKILMYIVMELARYLVKQNVDTISILVEKAEEKACLKVCHKIEDSDLLNKVKQLAYLDEKINVNEEYEQIVISIG